MTMVDGGAAAAVTLDEASWHMVEDGFWVGNARGMFLGTIERVRPGRFLARSETSSCIGEHRSLAAAEAAVMERFG